MTRPKPVTLTDDAFLKFRDFIYRKCGIFYGEKKKYLLESRLSHRIEALKLRNAEEYYMLLRYHPQGRKELERVFDAVTNPETSFFRTPDQLNVFRELLLPEAIEARRNEGRRTLRLWSAACSTGEEPYTLAMLVRETLGPDLPDWTTYIYANDISPRVLDEARGARYGAYTLRRLPEDLKAAYFRPAPGMMFDLDPEVRRMVSFDQTNLVSDNHSFKTRDMDVIFCRNVLMYFDLAAKRKVVDRFYESLRRGGTLVLGASESLYDVSRAFRSLRTDEAIVYRKE